ncbi:autophagy protein [Dunaliella salina]|uniref:Ubiquitin-like protein ATG12 n=1 Tax=Dunaliella salina TaxID=3046 RepID=A0ABQ7G221_DUNSA|nr:autophagy protein [Dunaliella salina]|eukprot:KAF5828653.1 autophagy protein [Dunaliella salina]
MDKKSQDDKIVVVFRATGGAPILQQSKVKVSADSKFSKLVVFLKKQLKTETVYVYLREAFAPSIDDTIAVLTQAYGIDGKLHVNYALTPAWG